jgi:hypothetical protein
MSHDSGSDKGSWWTRCYALVTLVVILGGCVTLLSWAELNIGAAALMQQQLRLGVACDAVSSSSSSSLPRQSL